MAALLGMGGAAAGGAGAAGGAAGAASGAATAGGLGAVGDYLSTAAKAGSASSGFDFSSILDKAAGMQNGLSGQAMAGIFNTPNAPWAKSKTPLVGLGGAQGQQTGMGFGPHLAPMDFSSLISQAQQQGANNGF